MKCPRAGCGPTHRRRRCSESVPCRTYSKPWRSARPGDRGSTGIRFTERNQRLDPHLVRVRLQTALDVNASLATLLQHDNADHAIGVNARFRYNFREGRDLWIVCPA